MKDRFYCKLRDNYNICLPILHQCCYVSDEMCEYLKKQDYDRKVEIKVDKEKEEAAEE